MAVLALDKLLKAVVTPPEAHSFIRVLICVRSVPDNICALLFSIVNSSFRDDVLILGIDLKAYIF